MAVAEGTQFTLFRKSSRKSGSCRRGSSFVVVVDLAVLLSRVNDDATHDDGAVRRVGVRISGVRHSRGDRSVVFGGGQHNCLAVKWVQK